MNIFWGMKNLWIFLGGHHIIGQYLGSILCILGSFLKGKEPNWRYFLGLLKFQIFLGA